jgi:hypothetical protein
VTIVTMLAAPEPSLFYLRCGLLLVGEVQDGMHLRRSGAANSSLALVPRRAAAQTLEASTAPSWSYA